jgi:single-strand DNA-binding protein
MDEMGQSVVITEWHRATVWGKKAEACIKYLSKGARVYVEGELRSSKWQDQKGIDRKTPEILVEEVRFLGNGRALADPEVSENSN